MNTPPGNSKPSESFSAEMDSETALQPTNQRRSAWLDWASPVARWVIGLGFVYMGASKALRPEHFLKLVLQYNMVSGPVLLNVIAATLPWFEVFCGLLLVAGIAVRGAALLLLGMLLSFTPLVMQRAFTLASIKALPFCAVKFDCGCGAGEVFICRKVAENLVLGLLSAWMILVPCPRWCVRFSLWKK